MKSMICITCPVGCRIRVDDNGVINGNRCRRGLQYAQTELTDPRRTLTTTVRTVFSGHPRLSVKTSAPIPKALLFDAMRMLDSVVVDRPVAIGTVIVENILGTQCDIIATTTCIFQP